MLFRSLEGSGHQVIAYGNGRVALDDLANHAADLVVTDIFMPEMEGLETIREVRALYPAMPIIAMSGISFADRDYLEMAEKFGAVASLKKPFRPAQLTELVKRLLAARDG